MALGKNLGLGLVKRTTSIGSKRILIFNHMDFHHSNNNKFSLQSSLLESLPQEILIKILCGVDHDDLKRLFHVSTTIRDAVIVAKKWHFEFSTPKKIPAFRCSLSLEEFPCGDFVEIEAPNAPKQLRVHHSRLTRKKSASICVSLFASSPAD